MEASFLDVLRVPATTFFYDSGEEVLGLSAASTRGILFEARKAELLRRLLARLGGRAGTYSDEDQEAIDLARELVSASLLADSSWQPNAKWQGRTASTNAFPGGRLAVSVRELSPAQAREELAALISRLTAADTVPPRLHIVVDIGTRELEDWESGLYSMLRSLLDDTGIARESVDFTFTGVLTSQNGAALQRFWRLVDRSHPRSELLFRAVVDGSVRGITTSDEDLVKAFSQEGFACIPSIPLEAGIDPQDAVARWCEVTDNAGLVVFPVIGPHPASPPLRGLQSFAEIDECVEGLGRITDRLDGSVLLRSTPWREVIQFVMNLPRVRRGWVRRFTRLTLCPDGWIVGDGGLGVARASTFGEVWHSIVELSEKSRAVGYRDKPSASVRCDRCALLPICDGYESADFDALMGAGQSSLAELVARYECETRKMILPRLMETMILDCKRGVRKIDDASTICSFQNGQMSLDRIHITSPT